MTPAEVDALLPNGFHDSVLRELHVDFGRAGARLTFDFLTGGRGVNVDGGFGPYPGDPEPRPDGLVRLWLYASTWNSGMRFVAEACDFGWTKVP